MNTVISVRIPSQLKNSAQEVAEGAGFKLSTLINAYLRQLVATRRIELYSPEPMTSKLEKLIESVEADLQAGKVSKKFDNADEFLADLKK